MLIDVATNTSVNNKRDFLPNDKQNIFIEKKKQKVDDLPTNHSNTIFNTISNSNKDMQIDSLFRYPNANEPTMHIMNPLSYPTMNTFMIPVPLELQTPLPFFNPLSSNRNLFNAQANRYGYDNFNNYNSSNKKDVFNSFIDAFNMNDIVKFQKVLQDHSSEQIAISSKCLKRDSIGISSLLILWVLILEGYPDAVINCIVSKEINRNCYEFNFNFAGTRITAHPVTVLYALAAEKLALGATVTSTELLNLVTKSSLNTAPVTPLACPFVSFKGKSVLTFDSKGKIIKWFFDMKL